MRVLVIDDSRAMRAIIGGILRQTGVEVVDACNGSDALGKLQQNGPFDLALVDWNMPIMNGYEFVNNVRSDPRYTELRLIMVTTETELIQISRALEAGANEYIMKPFTRDILLEKVNLFGIGSQSA